MTGPDLEQELGRRRQEIPIAFMTAQEDETVRPRMLEQGPWSACPGPQARRRSWQSLRHPEWTEESAMPVDGGTDMKLNERISPRSGSSVSHPTPIVFIVDDDISVRESLELLIRSAGWTSETFASAREFLLRSRTLTPSCLVLDVDLPDLSGLEVQKLVADRIDMPIIFITGYGDVPMTVRAMKAGAVEFLTKPFSDDVLLTAIQDAIERSRTALSQEAALRTLRDRHASLTRREREVMALVVSGLLNKQVGGELGISEITVKAHRGQVMRKMKADSLADLVTMAATLRLGPPPTGVAGRNGCL
jgi:FixJ family two-component response regulator